MYFNMNLIKNELLLYNGEKKGFIIMQTEAQKRAQKEANKKSLMFSANYRLNDLQEGKRLKVYLESTGQSANSYLKELIKKDLDSKGV